VEHFVRENYDSVAQQDQHIRARAAARRQPAEVEEAERQERIARLDAARQRIRRQKQERNGDSAAG
jgi:hypothetical protein